jgi:uncharacterized protein (TIGR00369 family)
VPPDQNDVSAIRDKLVSGEIDPRAFFEMVNEHSHNGLIGVKYVTNADNWVELAIDYDEKLVGDPKTGILASGPIISLCDMASGMCIMFTTGRFFQTVTIDLRVDYLRPAKVGNRVTGHMECYRYTKNVAFVRGYAHDGDADSPIANVTGTFMFLESQ